MTLIRKINKIVLLEISVCLLLFIACDTNKRQHEKHESLISKDTLEASEFIKQGTAFLAIKVDSVLPYALKAIESSNRIKWRKGQWTGNELLAKYFQKKEQLDSAFFYFQKSLQICELHTDSFYVDILQSNLDFLKAATYNNLGQIFYASANYNLAIQNHLKALEIQDNYKTSTFTEDLGIAKNYLAINEIDSAFNIYKKVRDNALFRGDSVSLIKAHSGFGTIFYNLKDIDNSIASFDSALIISKAINYDEIYTLYSNLGGIYPLKSINDPANEDEYSKKGREYLIKALDVSDSIGIKQNQAAIRNNIGNYYRRIGQLNFAEKYYLEALEISEKNNLKDYKLTIFQALAKLYAEQGKFEMAYNYSQAALNLGDSISNSKVQIQANTQIISYEYKKQQMELKAQKDSEIQQQKNRAILAMSFAAISILLAYAFVRNIKIKKKIELQKSIIEKNIVENSFLRTRMDPHFVSNCIRSAKMFIIRSEHDGALKYLERFDNSMRNLVEMTGSDLVTLEIELNNIRNYLELEEPRIENGLEWEIIIDENVDTEDIEVPPLIFQPFVENAAIHGIKNIDKKGKILICIKNIKDRIILIIEDNGRGFKADAIKNSSKGIDLTIQRLSMFTKLNKADATIKIEHLVEGTRVIIEFNA